jgi:hypothetical protein
VIGSCHVLAVVSPAVAAGHGVAVSRADIPLRTREVLVALTRSAVLARWCRQPAEAPCAECHRAKPKIIMFNFRAIREAGPLAGRGPRPEVGCAPSRRYHTAVIKI